MADLTNNTAELQELLELLSAKVGDYYPPAEENYF